MTDLAEQMDAALDAGYDENYEEPIGDGGLPEERFRIKDAGTADWALRKLARLDARAEEVTMLANEQRERISTFEANELHRVKDEGERLRSLLHEYHQGVLAEDPRQRVIRLPHGRVRFLKAQDEWTVLPSVFLPWAKGNAPELVRVHEEPNLADAKRVLRHKDLTNEDPGTTVPVVTADGEPVEGIRVTRRPDVWKVEPGSWT